jgi:hypothetical protein
VPRQELERFFSKMVNRFFITLGPKRIARCIRIWRSLGEEPFTYDSSSSGDPTFIVCAPDSKALSDRGRHGGQQREHRIDIFTTLDGTALDIYQVTDPDAAR